MRTVAALIALLGGVASASAQEVVLTTGEAAFVEYSDNSGFWAVTRSGEAVVPGAIEAHADAVQSSSAAATEETLTTGKINDARITNGRVKFSFAKFAGRPGRLLMVENGYQRTFAYRAVIHLGSTSMPTTVCTVIPNTFGIESWPYDFESIVLTKFELSEARSRQPVCE